jgi:hypothetical protein
MKKVLGLATLFIGVFLLAQFVYADMTDKATLGGQSTTNGVYDWRVDLNGNLIPGTTNNNNVGSASNKVANVNTTNVNTVTLTVTGITNLANGVNWTALGNIQGVNWTGANITTSGINWESVRMLSTPGNNSSGTNWQAFGV